MYKRLKQDDDDDEKKTVKLYLLTSVYNIVFVVYVRKNFFR
jgi:hypothetical protein